MLGFTHLGVNVIRNEKQRSIEIGGASGGINTKGCTLAVGFCSCLVAGPGLARPEWRNDEFRHRTR